MKITALLPPALACLVAPVHASEVIFVAENITVEEAWAKVDSAGIIEVFLVINNAGPDGAALGIEVPGATDVRVVDAAGRTLKPSIPIHSELYMKPDGVRIVATGLSASSTVPVSVTIGTGDPVVILAELRGEGQAVPDHHDYDHG